MSSFYMHKFGGDYIKNLKIYVDESGDFGFVKNSSELYVVSLVLHDTTKSIKSNLNFLNEKLKSLNFNSMIHTADLIANVENMLI